MADAKLSPSTDGRISITVPSERFERFRKEVLFDLNAAGRNLAEASEWASDEKRSEEVRTENLIRVTREELPRVRGVEEVWRQVDLAAPPEQDTTVTGDHKVLRSTLIGCALSSADEIREVVERPDQIEATREATAGLNYWLNELEALDWQLEDAEEEQLS